MTDCIETDEKNNICIVEYKPTKPKTGDYNYEDLMQVFAKKVCVVYIFNYQSKKITASMIMHLRQLSLKCVKI